MSLTATDPGTAAKPGHNQLGTISISDSVVAKLAAQAASEVPDAGAAATKLLGVTMPGMSLLGTRDTNLDDLPKASAKVDGAVAVIELSLSVRWPASIATVTGEVRQRVRTRLKELAGIDVVEVRILVTELVTTLAPPPRVR